jgi:hypothetical protein
MSAFEDDDILGAAVKAELAALAAARGPHFAAVVGKIYSATLGLMCSLSDVAGVEPADVLGALLRILATLDETAAGEAARIRARLRAERARQHGQN